ncbi:hypothetical protein FRC08_011865 [Ceratobasidium sp. 394]|nr:hypothetical protein FRC08_011865 [Ceratobasidium sp. 394]
MHTTATATALNHNISGHAECISCDRVWGQSCHVGSLATRASRQHGRPACWAHQPAQPTIPNLQAADKPVPNPHTRAGRLCLAIQVATVSQSSSHPSTFVYTLVPSCPHPRPVCPYAPARSLCTPTHLTIVAPGLALPQYTIPSSGLSRSPAFSSSHLLRHMLALPVLAAHRSSPLFAHA